MQTFQAENAGEKHKKKGLLRSAYGKGCAHS